MAKRILSEQTIADVIYAKFGAKKLRKAWNNYVSEHTEDEDITNVEDYIIMCDPELTEWLEMLIPYLPSFSTIDDIIEDYFRGEYYKSDIRV